jgi:mRNA-degrading endonuclease RelE of RelBE toxin-antitoxin system
VNEPYELAVVAPARPVLAETLPEPVAAAAWELISGPLRENPHRVGKPLFGPFAGQHGARRGQYRVRYRIDENKHRVVVLDVIARADAYRAR